VSETGRRAKWDAAEDGQDDTPQAACNAFMMTVPQAPRSGGFFFATLSFSPVKKKASNRKFRPEHLLEIREIPGPQAVTPSS